MSQRAVFRLHGATCPSCAMAIERYGGKLDGVEEIHVDTASKEILVKYSGSEVILQEIPRMVEKLGYSAERKENPA